MSLSESVYVLDGPWGQLLCVWNLGCMLCSVLRSLVARRGSCQEGVREVGALGRSSSTDDLWPCNDPSEIKTPLSFSSFSYFFLLLVFFHLEFFFLLFIFCFKFYFKIKVRFAHSWGSQIVLVANIPTHTDIHTPTHIYPEFVLPLHFLLSRGNHF